MTKLEFDNYVMGAAGFAVLSVTLSSITCGFFDYQLHGTPYEWIVGIVGAILGILIARKDNK